MKFLFFILLGFNSVLVYQLDIDSTSYKVVNKFTIDLVLLNGDCIIGSIVNDIRKPILFTFALDKPPGFNVTCESERIHYKKVNHLLWLVVNAS